MKAARDLNNKLMLHCKIVKAGDVYLVEGYLSLNFQ